MADDTGIRQELRDRTGWSPQNLSNRVRSLRDNGHLMSRQHALYVLAHEQGVDLENFGVEADTLIKVGQLSRSVRDVPVTSRQASEQPKQSRAGRRVTVSVDGVDVGMLPSLLASHTREADQRSAKAYHLLYLIEQSIRHVISRVLSDTHGEAWWDNAVDSTTRKKAESRQKDDDLDPWHSARGDHPLDYLDIWDYARIIVDDSNWPLFEPIFDRPEFVTETLREINVSRRVVAHMNGLSRHDFERLKTTFRKWMKHLKARESDLPGGPT